MALDFSDTDSDVAKVLCFIDVLKRRLAKTLCFISVLGRATTEASKDPGANGLPGHK